MCGGEVQDRVHGVLAHTGHRAQAQWVTAALTAMAVMAVSVTETQRNGAGKRAGGLGRLRLGRKKAGANLRFLGGGRAEAEISLSVSLWQLLPYPQLWGRSIPAGQSEGVGAGAGLRPPSIPSPLSLPHPRLPPTAQIPALKAATRLSACRA